MAFSLRSASCIKPTTRPVPRRVAVVVRAQPVTKTSEELIKEAEELCRGIHGSAEMCAAAWEDVEEVAAAEAAAAQARLEFRKKSAMGFVAARDNLEKQNADADECRVYE